MYKSLSNFVSHLDQKWRCVSRLCGISLVITSLWLPQQLLAQSCQGVVDLWIVNDENLDNAEFADSLDFWYALADEFVGDDVRSLKGGGIAWNSTDGVASIVEPLTENFSTPGSSGLRGIYNSTIADQGSGAQEIIGVTIELASRINDGADTDGDGVTNRGRREGVPQVAVFLVGSSLSNVTIPNWQNEMVNLAGAGPDGVSIHLLLAGDAESDYSNNAGIASDIDTLIAAIGGSLTLENNYADLDANHATNVANDICSQSAVFLELQQTANPLFTTGAAPYDVDFIFDEAVTGFVEADIVVMGGASVVAASLSQSGNTYTVSIQPDASEQDISVSAPFGVADLAGRPNTGAAIQRFFESAPLDGISDTDEGRDRVNDAQSEDTDGDGTADYLDPDSDGDGIPDSDEAGSDPLNLLDTDGDGIFNFRDRDSDGDEILDIVEFGPDLTPRDSDGDSVPDYLDEDSDNDTIPDVIENETAPRLSGVDKVVDESDPTIVLVVGNGIDNNVDTTYGDAFSNIPEPGKIVIIDDDPLAGNDHPQRNNVHDPFEAADTDGDFIPNYRDLDSDNDGVLDIVEANIAISAPLNTDGDLIDPIDDRENRILEKFDFVDIDADNDGIADANETPDLGLTLPEEDVDGDGVDDEVDENTGSAGGLSDINSADLPGDFDGDSTPDYRDLDADNDGIPDVLEAGFVDINSDAILDDLTEEGNSLVPNTDGVDEPDFRDLDSNNDGQFDFDPLFFPGLDLSALDSNADGELDDPADDDGDGLADGIDFFDGFGAISDFDNDMVPDFDDRMTIMTVFPMLPSVVW